MSDFVGLDAASAALLAMGLERAEEYYSHVYFCDPDNEKRSTFLQHEQGLIRWDDIEMNLCYSNIDIDEFRANLLE